MMYNVFVAKQSIEIGYSNVGYIRKGSISVIQVKEMLVMARVYITKRFILRRKRIRDTKNNQRKQSSIVPGWRVHETFWIC